MLYINIKSLTKPITDFDWFSKNDLFIKVIYANQVRQTTVMWDENEPVWNESFLLHIDKSKSDIKLELYDHNSWSPNKKIYESTIKIHNKSIISIQADIFNIDMGIINYSEKNMVAKLQNEIDRLTNFNSELQKEVKCKENDLCDINCNFQKELNHNKTLSYKINQIQSILNNVEYI